MAASLDCGVLASSCRMTAVISWCWASWVSRPCVRAWAPNLGGLGAIGERSSTRSGLVAIESRLRALKWPTGRHGFGTRLEVHRSTIHATSAGHASRTRMNSERLHGSRVESDSPDKLVVGKKPIQFGLE